MHSIYGQRDLKRASIETRSYNIRDACGAFELSFSFTFPTYTLTKLARLDALSSIMLRVREAEIYGTYMLGESERVARERET